MIKGLPSGYRGPIYIYYRGKQQVVLADVHAGFNMGTDLAATSLRIVLHPGQWTETDFDYVSKDFNEHRGQLYFLERDGYVDIYTNKEEVDALKQGKTLEQVNVEKAAATQPVQPQPQQKYFNMQMFTKDGQSTVQTTEVPAPLPSVQQGNDMLDALKKQQDLMAKQMEAMTQMTAAMANLMNKFSDKLDKKD